MTISRLHSPIHQQVLLHSEALTAGVPLGSVLGPPRFLNGLVLRVTLKLRVLHQFILLHRTVVPSLLPDPRSVNHQSILTRDTIWG